MTLAHQTATARHAAGMRQAALDRRKPAPAPQPSLIAQPQALSLLLRGVETLAAPLALTLGPRRSLVMNTRTRNEVELLTDSSTIARRVLRLPGRGNNLGAMMMRKMALELHERQGDGVATAAVMTRAMLRQANRLITAGANPALMAQGIKLAVDAASAALTAQAIPVSDEEELIALACSVTGDSELGSLLGQMFGVMGEYATVITQDMPRPCLDHEYIRGGKWDGYIPARQLIPEGDTSLILHNPLIVLTDEELTTIEQVQPILELALAEPAKPPLLIIARGISNDALTMLTANHVRGVLSIGMFVLSSGILSLLDDLEDMAALTGGKAFSALTGSQVRDIQQDAFGRAQQALLSTNGLTIAGGKGQAPALQQRITEVRALLKRVSRSENSEWELLRVRLARLTGGIGVLKIGTSSEQELEIKKAQISKVQRVLELAYEQGLVPGGGSAFLACLPALQCARQSCHDEDERYGFFLVEEALTAPFLQIVHNHGEIHPPLALDRVQHLGPGYGFDALSGEYVCMSERRILDCLSIAQGALTAAASVASMILTTDTIVFNR